ncbi:hypothetical protein [Nocardioides psychrotolerans]|uniref:hypothetical protein n=1 Tax=Nocardioides psychrotolerans TaxID=1005945 RepID=UPI000B831847|nr:hypothetical protein [Nocardioides psychrotolerans]
MPGYQRILVVSTTADEAEVRRIRGDLGRDPLVLTAPTAEAGRVVRVLGVEPQVEVLLAAVTFPPVDRGHRLDELVRAHALRDRFRDVVVVTDPATATLLLRGIAPDQLPTRGALTVVGLVRGDRPVATRRGLAVGVVLGFVAAAVAPPGAILLPGVVALLGLVFFFAQPWRHLGRELLLAATVAVGVGLVVIASSARFPGGW